MDNYRQSRPKKKNIWRRRRKMADTIYMNRELSWLKFTERVLEDPDIRMQIQEMFVINKRFLCIFLPVFRIITI
ncbi:hypothetical protein [Blautia massiliensis (ex Durand et al. 2017)]|uniref:hypothetical protein n=1 Tax=Blautia massiliensis (ex Durand et al. 2017) TaxID=1737424 RepID=UPI003B503464